MNNAVFEPDLELESCHMYEIEKTESENRIGLWGQNTIPYSYEVISIYILYHIGFFIQNSTFFTDFHHKQYVLIHYCHKGCFG